MDNKKQQVKKEVKSLKDLLSNFKTNRTSKPKKFNLINKTANINDLKNSKSNSNTISDTEKNATYRKIDSQIENTTKYTNNNSDNMENFNSIRADKSLLLTNTKEEYKNIGHSKVIKGNKNNYSKNESSKFNVAAATIESTSLGTKGQIMHSKNSSVSNLSVSNSLFFQHNNTTMAEILSYRNKLNNNSTYNNKHKSSKSTIFNESTIILQKEALNSNINNLLNGKNVNIKSLYDYNPKKDKNFYLNLKLQSLNKKLSNKEIMFEVLSKEKLLFLFLNFLNFEFTNLIKSSKRIKMFIVNYLKLKSRKFILEQFQEKYNAFFTIKEQKIVLSNNKNNNLKYNFDLKFILQIKIPKKFNRNTIDISYNFKNSSNVFVNNLKNSKLFCNFFKFDYSFKPSKSKIWAMKEFKKDDNLNDLNLLNAFHSFCQPILTFSDKDLLEINFNLLSQNNKMINFESVTFNDLKYESIEDVNYLEYSKPNLKGKKLQKDICEFNLSRYCELELIKNNFKVLDFSINNNNNNNKEIIKEFLGIVKGCFKVKQAFFDDSIVTIYKFILKANKIGKILFNLFF